MKRLGCPESSFRVSELGAFRAYSLPESYCLFVILCIAIDRRRT